MSEEKVVVIGAGFAGLSAATHLADAGEDVVIFEKNQSPGGRARNFEAEGFHFDMGPSWYWMPDVFENYFKKYGKKPGDYYQLVRLNPSYKVFYGVDDAMELPSALAEYTAALEVLEPGISEKLHRFLEQAAYKYQVGIHDLVHKPSLSLTEFARLSLVRDLLRLDLFQPMSKHVRKFFKNGKIIQLMEFPVLFLGETAQNIPALYSLMNYADIVLGTWYPMGGMHEVVKGMVQLAEEKGVAIRLGEEVTQINVHGGTAHSITLSNGENIRCKAIVAGADYHYVDQQLLDKPWRNYSPHYWENRTLAPSSLLFFLGIDIKLKNLQHHNLFFDEPLEAHADAIYKKPRWPERPLFYVSAPSVTDPSVAPPDKENLFILIPLAPDLEDNEAIREKYFHIVMDRLEKLTKQNIRQHITYKRSYAHRDFKKDYHAYKGNAYGLANTLSQTAILKPSLKNKKVPNLFYAGQLTVPGPGVPPSLISGEVVAKEVIKKLKA
ncbi:phytoene desaturase family protein [Negadavirga shengliensis]|uniref:Phytoene desaturase family protein n=1 Tax=Negadavirga shengliensis TaxID=1389218 RepID=A0ABV9T0S2_9BACT